MSQSRFHYSNIFHPNLKKAYSSNYQLAKKNDIEITNKLNLKFLFVGFFISFIKAGNTDIKVTNKQKFT